MKKQRPRRRPTNLLEIASQKLTAEFRTSGLTVTDLEAPTDTGKYTVTFVPREGAPRITAKVLIIPAEPCPSCGSILDPNGRCHACWGDVMGLCGTCNGILEDGFFVIRGSRVRLLQPAPYLSRA